MGGGCCSSPGNNEQFDERTARWSARWHRWFGLARSERDIVADAADPPPLEPADVVVLHRVVCCTDAWAAMLDTALSVGPRLVALTLPRSTWWIRAFARVGNALERRRGRDFRVRIHDPAAVLGHLQAADMTVVDDTGGAVWRTVVLEAELEPATPA